MGRGDLVFDVGANEGNRVEAFVKLGARVVAIEPQRRCVENLREKWPDITVENIALGSKPGVAELRLADTTTIASMSSDFISATTASGRFGTVGWGEETESVGVTTLDHLIRRYGKPAFIKIDVEGFEPEVLAGLSQPVQALSFEVAAELDGHAVACIDRLDALASYRFAMSHGESMRLGSWLEAGEARELIRSLPTLAWGDLYATLFQAEGEGDT